MLLEVDGVEAGYGGAAVLHGVSLSVGEEEIVALLGPNGAGKTTLVKALCGLLPLSGGTVRFRGADLTVRRPHELPRLGIGCVPQISNVFPSLTVEENLRVSHAAEQSRGGATDALDRTFDLFPALGERRRQRARTLSGGERQMLALASALVLEPRFLILDEPTSGLAPSVVRALVEKIASVREGGTAVLWIVGENIATVVKHVDRAFMLDSGVITRAWNDRDQISEAVLQEALFGTRARESVAARSPGGDG